MVLLTSAVLSYRGVHMARLESVLRTDSSLAIRFSADQHRGTCVRKVVLRSLLSRSKLEEVGHPGKGNKAFRNGCRLHFPVELFFPLNPLRAGRHRRGPVRHGRRDSRTPIPTGEDAPSRTGHHPWPFGWSHVMDHSFIDFYLNIDKLSVST